MASTVRVNKHLAVAFQVAGYEVEELTSPVGGQGIKGEPLAPRTHRVHLKGLSKRDRKREFEEFFRKVFQLTGAPKLCGCCWGKEVTARK